MPGSDVGLACAARKAPGTRRARRAGRRPPPGGFTLVEVLVALFAMALLAGFAWRSLQTVVEARDAGREEIDRTTRLATVLAQWEQDLQAVHDTQLTPSALAFDGRSLRLTRRLDEGVALVVWSVQDGRWRRWATPPVQRGAELTDAWLRSLQLTGAEPAQVTVAEAAGLWQIYFFRGGWSNAQSTGDLAPSPPQGGGGGGGGGAPPPQRELLPEAVRLVIDIGGQSLTRDIVLGVGGR